MVMLGIRPCNFTYQSGDTHSHLTKIWKLFLNYKYVPKCLNKKKHIAKAEISSVNTSWLTSDVQLYITLWRGNWCRSWCHRIISFPNHDRLIKVYEKVEKWQFKWNHRKVACIMFISSPFFSQNLNKSEGYILYIEPKFYPFFLAVNLETTGVVTVDIACYASCACVY